MSMGHPFRYVGIALFFCFASPLSATRVFESDPAWLRYAEPCRYWRMEGNLGLVLGAAANRCVVVHEPLWTRLSSFVSGPHGRMPLVVRLPPGNTPISRIVIEIIGGPIGRLEETEDTAYARLRRNIVSRGAVFITIGYMGTYSRTQYPHPDMPAAIDETVFYRDWIRRRNAGVPIVMLGSSLGGYVLAAVSAHVENCTCVYFEPLLETPRHLADQTIARIGAQAAERELAQEQIAYLWSSEGWASHLQTSRLLTYRDLFWNFFGSYLDVRFADIAVRNPSGCSTLIYGDRDPKIGVDQVPLLAVSHRLHIVAIPNLTHGLERDLPSEAAAGAVTEAIFDDRCEAVRVSLVPSADDEAVSARQ
jgi:hypothetical protein